MSRKSSALILVLLAALVVLIAGGIWRYDVNQSTLLTQSTSTPSPTSTTTPNETIPTLTVFASTTADSGWVTYTSPLGFSFVYPTGWSFEPGVDSLTIDNPNPNSDESIEIQTVPLSEYGANEMFLTTTSTIDRMPALERNALGGSDSIAVKAGNSVIEMSYYDLSSDIISHIAQSLTITTHSPALPVITTDNAGNQTYTNPFYGFSISFPESVVATTTGEYFTGTYSDDSNLPGEEILGLLVDSIESSDTNGAGYYHAQINIGVSQDSTAVQTCLSSTDATQSSTVVINGITFYKYVLPDEPGLGQDVEVMSYRAVKNNTCFAVEPTFTTGSDAAINPSATAVNRDQQVIDSIINSLAFPDQ